MSRARWLRVYGIPRAMPVSQRVARSCVDLAVALALIVVGATLIAAALLRGVPWLLEWTAADVLLDPPMQLTLPAAPAPRVVKCRPPTEHEQLLIAVYHDEGGNVSGDCSYIGPRGAYRRTPQGMPEPRP